MNKQKILITGGAGYIGSVLVPTLLEKGYKVTVFDNLMYNQLSLLDCAYYPDFNLIIGDVRDKEKLINLCKENDVIIPLAAIVGMPACKKDKQLAHDVNFEHVKTIIENTTPIQKIIYPCTNSGYGVGQEGIFCTEETPLNPISFYGKTKVDAEKICLDSKRAITIRLATVFGMSPRMRMDLLVNDLVYRAMTDKFLVIFESHFIRNYIHVRDVANTFLFLIENYEKCVGNVYNVGLSSANISKLHLAEKIKEYLPKTLIILNEFEQDSDKRNYIVSNKKLESLGWLPTYSLDEGIQELLKGYQIINNYKNTGFSNL